MTKVKWKEEKWNNGTLEYWVYEKMLLFFCIIPSFHYSRISFGFSPLHLVSLIKDLQPFQCQKFVNLFNRL